MTPEDPALAVFRTKLQKAGKSKRTFATYRFLLEKHLFPLVRMDPSEFVEAVKARRIDPAEVVNRATDSMAEQGLKRSYIRLTVAAAKKLIKTNTGKEIEYFSEVGLDEIGRENKTKERGLNPEDILKMLTRGACKSERDEALVLFDCASGLREQELAGLNMGDIQFEEGRTIVVVRDEIAKGKHGYVTFLTPEACDSLKKYLDKRGESGESLDVSSPLFVERLNGIKGPRKGDDRLSPHTVGEIIRAIYLRAGLIPPPSGDIRTRHDVKPHSLRKFTRRMYQKADVDVLTAEKLEGRGSGSIAQVYTPQSVDELWESYKTAIPFLTIKENVPNGRIKSLQEENQSLRAKLDDVAEKVNRATEMVNAMAERYERALKEVKKE